MHISLAAADGATAVTSPRSYRRPEAAMTSRSVIARAAGVLMIAAASLLFLPSAADARTITTIAGTGVAGYSGDGGPAVQSQLNRPRGITVAADGAILFADSWNDRVRRIAPDGTITTAAGSHASGFGGDGGPGTSARLDGVLDVAVAPDGGFYIADNGNFRVRRVLPNGTISTVAGNGALGGGSGDGGPATSARLSDVGAIAITTDGSLLIADWLSSRIRRVSPTGIISTAVGVGGSGFNGDNRPAAGAQLDSPEGVAATPDGGFLIADTYNSRIRKVSASGVITTVAGTGTSGFSGDGGQATGALVRWPSGIAVLSDGGFVFADTGNHRIRQVSAEGVITTIAGTGVQGFAGDGGSAIQADINTPGGVARTADGAIVFTEIEGHRIRRISPPIVPAPAPSPSPAPSDSTPAPAPAGPSTPAAQIMAPTLRVSRVDSGRILQVRATLPVGARRTAKFQISSRGRWITRATARTTSRGQVRGHVRVRIADFANRSTLPVRIRVAGRTYMTAPFRRAQVPAVRQRLMVRATIIGATGRTALIQLRTGARWSTLARGPISDSGRITRNRILTTRQTNTKSLRVRISLTATDTAAALIGPSRMIRLKKR